MNKVLKAILISLLSLSVIAIIVLLVKMDRRLPQDSPEHSGNSAGNLYNNGFFVEDENYIYFSDISNNYRICKMDKKLKHAVVLGNDSAINLNLSASSDYLYYQRINYKRNNTGNTIYDLSSKGIFRLGLKKKSLTMLFRDITGSLLLLGNRLVFQVHGSDGSFDLYSLRTDKKKTSPKLLTTDPITPVCTYGEKLFFSDVKDNHSLYSLNPENGESSLYAALNCYLPVATAKGFYFLSQAHDYALYFLPYTSDTATEIISERLCTYTIAPDEKTIYFQVDNSYSNRICRLNLDNHREDILLEGDFKNLNAVSHYLFFTDFDEKICYCYDQNTNQVSPFLPDFD